MPWMVTRQLPNNGAIETGALPAGMTVAQYKAQVEPHGFKIISSRWQDSPASGGEAPAATGGGFGLSPAGWLLIGGAALWWMTRGR